MLRKNQILIRYFSPHLNLRLRLISKSLRFSLQSDLKLKRKTVLTPSWSEATRGSCQVQSEIVFLVSLTRILEALTETPSMSCLFPCVQIFHCWMGHISCVCLCHVLVSCACAMCFTRLASEYRCTIGVLAVLMTPGLALDYQVNTGRLQWKATGYLVLSLPVFPWL